MTSIPSFKKLIKKNSSKRNKTNDEFSHLILYYIASHGNPGNHFFLAVERMVCLKLWFERELIRIRYMHDKFACVL